MGLIQYTNIENNVPATANMFNERFGQIVDELNGNLDGTNLKDESIPLSKLAVDVFSRLYPIGSLYMNATDDTNPGTLLGFGTWEAFGKGRVPVGKADSGTFVSAGAELGTESEVLTVDQLASHNHPGSTSQSGDHQHSYVGPPGQKILPIHGSGDSNHGFNDGTMGRVTSASGNHTHSVSTENRGGNQPHNNIQPSVVVYMWRRTG